MDKKIIFTKMHEVSDHYLPKPASSIIPEWYKKTRPYHNENGKKELDTNFSVPATIKKCIPVLDSLSTGYIIPTYCDLWIKKNDQGDIVYVTSHNINIEFHPVLQAPYHPKMNQYPYPKWINPWGIKTPKGYSCLFIPPVHGGNKFFTIAEGVVDTDSYSAPVNFPFVLNDTNFEGLIPAGTPMVQVIPFKRDSWKMDIGSEEDIKNNNSTMLKLQSVFFDRYKSLFWEKKRYQ